MSDFRTKLLGLAALGIAMAGVSSAQTINCGPNGANTSNIIVGTQGAPGNPATLRQESQTELVQDITTTGTNCTASSATSGIVYVTLNATVTSKSTGANGLTDAVLLVNGTFAAFGTASGSQLVFSNVSIPTGAFSFEIADVRVNAATATTPNVTESVNIEYLSNQSNTGSANLITGALQVGYIQPSLSFYLANIGGNGNSSQTFNSYLVCAGNPLGTLLYSTGATNLAFTVDVKELTPGAFKQQLSPEAAIDGAGFYQTEGGENGSYISGANGLASGPTNILLTLANVPSAATVYLPLSTTVTGSNVTLTLLNATALTGSQFQNTAGNLPFPNSGGVVAFTPANGSVVATYAVSTAGFVQTGQPVFPIPVEITFAKNTAPVQTTPISVLVSYAPSAATLTGPATAVPTFAVSTATPIPATVINPCATTLLYPYVTNYQGTYETGIAITNATTDNLGTSGASTATATPGTCTINFYGNQAQPAAVTTPTIGAWSTTSGSPSPVYANTLSAMTGLTNFTGYAIAQCNFLDAHGFAFITDYTLGGADAFAQGYLAVVVPNNRSVQDSGAGTGNGE